MANTLEIIPMDETSTTPPNAELEALERSISNSQLGLFRLPPEIRSHIWELLFEDRAVHIGQLGPCLRGYPRGCHPCTATQPDTSSLVDNDAWLTRHLSCLDHPNAELMLSLQLSRVCRQMHLELSILALSTIEFTFSDRVYLEYFLARLKPWQREAIHNITLYCTTNRCPWRLPFSDRTIFRLTGLRRLRVFAELGRSDFLECSSSNALTRDTQDMRFEGLARLRIVPIREVEVVIAQPRIREIPNWVPLSEYVVGAWAKRTRKMILREGRVDSGVYVDARDPEIQF